MTVLEVAIAVSIAMLMGIALVSLAQGSRVYAKQSDVQQFDAAFAYTQSLAATSGDGATLAFSVRRLTIYSGRSSASAIAPISLTGDVSEAVLGVPPFSIFIDGAGHASCPSGEQEIALAFGDPQGRVTRTIPCNAPVAGDPVTLGSVPQ